MRCCFAILPVLVGVLAGICGCQSVQSTRLVGSVEDTGGSSEETGERKIFLELSHPEPAWVAEESTLREQWLTTSYEEDRARPFRAFTLPDRYEVPARAFRQDPSQRGPTGPYLTVQLRERQFATVKKTHHVVTRSVLSGEKAGTRDVPVFSYWKWDGTGPDGESRVIRVRVADLEEHPGAWYETEGQAHQSGSLRIPLTPWLDADRIIGRKAPLVVEAACPSLGLAITVRIPADALFELRQLGTGSPAAED